MAKTFADLKADIEAWTHRSDLTATIPSFVYLAEQEIFRHSPYKLRVREMEAEATITITGSVGSVPADFLQARYLRVGDATLLWMPPEQWTSYHSGFFTVVAGEIRLPTDVTGDCVLVYYAMPASLSGDADTNDVLDGYYAIYLYASLKQAFAFARNTESAMQYDNQLSLVLSNANNGNRFSESGPLTVRTA